MKRIKKASLVILIILAITVALTIEDNQKVSIIASILIVLLCLIQPILLKLLFSNNPKTTGKVISITDTGYLNRTLATIEFEYEGIAYQIHESYNSNEVPKIGTEFTVTIDNTNIYDSVFHKSQDNYFIYNIIISLFFILMLIYKYFLVNV